MPKRFLTPISAAVAASAMFPAMIVGQAPLPADGNYFADVDGRRYRVVVKRGAVFVHNKATTYRFTMDERDRQRIAVVKATACKPIDELDSVAAGRLKARLDCTSSYLKIKEE